MYTQKYVIELLFDRVSKYYKITQLSRNKTNVTTSLFIRKDKRYYFKK